MNRNPVPDRKRKRTDPVFKALQISIAPCVTEEDRKEYHRARMARHYPSTPSDCEKDSQVHDQSLQTQNLEPQIPKGISSFEKLKEHLREVVARELNGIFEIDGFWKEERPELTPDVFPSPEEIDHLSQEALDEILNRVRWRIERRSRIKEEIKTYGTDRPDDSMTMFPSANIQDEAGKVENNTEGETNEATTCGHDKKSTKSTLFTQREVTPLPSRSSTSQKLLPCKLPLTHQDTGRINSQSILTFRRDPA